MWPAFKMAAPVILWTNSFLAELMVRLAGMAMEMEARYKEISTPDFSCLYYALLAHFAVPEHLITKRCSTSMATNFTRIR